MVKIITKKITDTLYEPIQVIWSNGIVMDYEHVAIAYGLEDEYSSVEELIRDITQKLGTKPEIEIIE